MATPLSQQRANKLATIKRRLEKEDNHDMSELLKEFCRISYDILFQEFEKEDEMNYWRYKRWFGSEFFDNSNEHDDGSCYSSCSGSDHGNRCAEDGEKYRNDAVMYNLEKNLKDFEQYYQEILEAKGDKKKLKFYYLRA